MFLPSAVEAAEYPEMAFVVQLLPLLVNMVVLFPTTTIRLPSAEMATELPLKTDCLQLLPILVEIQIWLPRVEAISLLPSADAARAIHDSGDAPLVFQLDPELVEKIMEPPLT